MKKKYYKVVCTVPDHVGGKQLYSISNKDGREVKYELNKWISAPNETRLFVFDDLNKAKSFRNVFKTRKIYECEIIGGIKGKGARYRDSMDDYWNIFNKELKKKKKIDVEKIMEKNGISLAYIDAILAKKVKLTKKVA
jgi:hypothetical protein